MRHHRHFGEELPAVYFSAMNSTLVQGVPSTDITDLHGNLLPGWRVLGWCANDNLPRPRNPEDAPEEYVWVGVLYEFEGRESYWMHHLAEKSDFSEGP